MFSISHPADGTFRLEIQTSPSALSRVEARRLRSVLLGLARAVEDADQKEREEPLDDDPGGGRTLPVRRRDAPLQREAS